MTPLELYRALYRIRKVEEEIAKVYPTDKIQSPIHLSIGQELASVAVCSALNPTDKVFGSYRSHALYLAKGGDLKAFVAELYGKATGCAKGKGGSMHLVESTAGLLGTSAIVASLIPVAVGYAWAQKMRSERCLTCGERKNLHRLEVGKDPICPDIPSRNPARVFHGGPLTVTAVFFGDGAAEEGCYFESLNFSVLHQLPILFVCENNGWAIHTPIKRRHAARLCDVARSFGIHSESPSSVNGMLEMSRRLTDAVRAGGGPRFLEARAPRLKEHVGPGEDWDACYRNKLRELDELGGDPVGQAAVQIDRFEKLRIEQAVDHEIREAFAFAEASPTPAPAELWTDLYG